MKQDCVTAFVAVSRNAARYGAREIRMATRNVFLQAVLKILRVPRNENVASGKAMKQR